MEQTTVNRILIFVRFGMVGVPLFLMALAYLVGDKYGGMNGALYGVVGLGILGLGAVVLEFRHAKRVGEKSLRSGEQ